MSVHDPPRKPPDELRTAFRALQKGLSKSLSVFDFNSLTANQEDEVLRTQWNPTRSLDGIYDDFIGYRSEFYRPAQCFEFKALPGLLVIPSLLPPSVQIALLDKLLHRDLSNWAHQTNLHLHHHVPYPESAVHYTDNSFFSQKPETTFEAKDPGVHRDLYLRDVLEKRLRWLTLGGQYNWTAKEYPHEKPPPFPKDLAQLIRQLFPFMEPQAAILNFYAPGDNLSIHRDVAESCDQGLVSLSIGCDAIFLVSGDDASQAVAIQLHSGDAVVMTGEARYAWHAVPKVIPDTSPKYLADWPATPASQGKYNEYEGYMINKRINLNIRQMFEP